LFPGDSLKKTYGKLSAEQFRRVVGTLPEVRKGTKDLPALLKQASPRQINEALDAGIYWAAFYEMPFVEHVALGLYLLGLKDWIHEVASANDPQEEALRALHRDDINSSLRGPEGEELTLASVLSVLVSFQRSMLCMMLYKRSMSALVEEVRGGDDDAFFDAIRIDRSVLALGGLQGQHEQFCFTYRGRPIGWEVTNNAWHTALRKACITDFRFHDLRHTWASWHRQAGTSCDELKDLGGWKSRVMVDRYAKYATEHLAVAVARIEGNRGATVIPFSTISPRPQAKRA
jgi:hypothetical protein